MLCCHILLVVDGQEPFHILFVRHADVKAAVPDALFQLLQGAVVFIGLGVDPVDENELPRRGGGGLDAVQMGHVPPEHLTDGGDLLLFQPGLVVVLIALKGLTGVQGQELRRVQAPEQVRQLNALLELKALGFSLDEIKGIVDGEASKGLLLRALERKRQAWQTAADEARHKAECLEGIMGSLEGSKEAEGIQRMTEEERAWLLAKLVCVEEVRAQRSLGEALWL